MHCSPSSGELAPRSRRACTYLIFPSLPDKACNCPNNCDYNLGHECKYIKSIAINSYTISGSEFSFEGFSFIALGADAESSLRRGRLRSPLLPGVNSSPSGLKGPPRLHELMMDLGASSRRWLLGPVVDDGFWRGRLSSQNRGAGGLGWEVGARKFTRRTS